MPHDRTTTPQSDARIYWLVESAAYTPRRYWTAHPHRANTWETDPAKAIRYATRDEAMRVVMGLPEECEACEHMDCGEPGPVLDKPALIGATRFGVGVKWSTVIDRAQREYEYRTGQDADAANLLETVAQSAREPGIRPAAFVGVMNALVRSCCYACGWPLGSCKPFDCGMRYSDGSEHLVEKKNWLKRAEDMAEVWKWIVAMQDAPVGPTANGAEMNNSGNIFPTLAANWEHFEKVDIAPTAPAIQRSEMQRAFYAGASTGLAQACFAQESGDFPGGIAELLAELKAWRGMRKASASPDSCGLKNTSKEE